MEHEFDSRWRHMKEGYRQYKIRIARWRSLYGSQQVKGEHDPAKLKVPTNRCAKCGSFQDLTRHHKGHEYYFACLLPETYAPRYIQFRQEDCVMLCKRGKRCHQRIHKLYDKIMKECWEYVSACLREIVYDSSGIAHFEWHHKPDFAALEGYRLRMVSRCDSWLLRKNKKYKPSSYRNTRDAQI